MTDSGTGVTTTPKPRAARPREPAHGAKRARPRPTPRGHRMPPRWTLVFAFLIAQMATTRAAAQVTGGDVAGTVRNEHGVPVAGVTVVLSGESFLEPRTMRTTSRGRFWFARVPPGRYLLQAEGPAPAEPAAKMSGRPAPSGARARQGPAAAPREVIVELGASVEVSIVLAASRPAAPPALDGSGGPDAEAIVAGARFATGQSVDRECIQTLPVARDEWAVIGLTPGTLLEEPARGGQDGRLQPGWSSREAALDQAWSVDGSTAAGLTGETVWNAHVFDTIASARVQTGGHDASIQAAGASVNVVTRSGGNVFRADGRWLWSGKALEASNLTPSMRAARASSGDPSIGWHDVSAGAGGPLRPARTWFFVSHAATRRTSALSGMPTGGDYGNRDPYDRGTLVHESASTDTTTGRVDWRVGTAHQFTAFASLHGRHRNPASASPDDAPESWNRLTALSPRIRVAHGAATGRFSIASQASYADTGFAHALQEPGFRWVQPATELTTGRWARSGRLSDYDRRTIEAKTDATWFGASPSFGEHQLTMGLRYRRHLDGETSHVGGGATANFRASTPVSATLYRDGERRHAQWNWSAYVSDRIVRGRFTLDAGMRIDAQDDRSGRSSVPGNILLPEALPAVSFEGVDAGVSFVDLAPRAGLAWDPAGNGRTTLKVHAGLYHDSGITASAWLDPSGATSTSWAWNDQNHDGFVQRSEFVPDALTVIIRPILLEPALISVDRALASSRTREVLAGVTQVVGTGLTLDAVYIYRRDDRDHVKLLDGVTSADFQAVTAAVDRCDQGRCEPGGQAVTYYELPVVPGPGRTVTTGLSFTSYHGVELTARQHLGRVRLNSSLTLNAVARHYPGPDSYQDPTLIPYQDGRGPASYNARWDAKASGTILLPRDVTASFVATGRDGYPLVRTFHVPYRRHLPPVDVPLDPIGTTRYGAVWSLDWRLSKSFGVGPARVDVAIEVFNAANSATVLRRVTTQNDARANMPVAVTGPRLARAAIRAKF